MSSNLATVVPAFRLPSSGGESLGDYCTKMRKGTSLSFWSKVYHAPMFLCCQFQRERWSPRGARRQKLLEASGRVGAILTTVFPPGCPQWLKRRDMELRFAFLALCTGESINHRWSFVPQGTLMLSFNDAHVVSLNNLLNKQSICLWFKTLSALYICENPFVPLSSYAASQSVNIWWRHQMETFSPLLAIREGNSPVNSPHTKASDAKLWCFLWSAPE